MIKALKEPASEIVSINDHVKSSEIQELSENIRAFEYCLSDKGAKAKLLKAARRANTMEIEENSTSSNLNFSAGAWHTVVLPSISYWNEVIVAKWGSILSELEVSAQELKGMVNKLTIR